jgi:hypothetical protein
MSTPSPPGPDVAMTYADGNAMGRLVQELDSADIYAAFSEIVDDSIRMACFEALGVVCTGCNRAGASDYAAFEAFPFAVVP